MYEYQNVSDTTQTLTHDGEISPRVVKPGEKVQSAVAIENPNFKFVGNSQDENKEETKETE